jgi:hypothetical protein
VLEQALEDLVQATGHLAHAHHRDIEGIEHLGVLGQRQAQFLARLQAAAHLLQRLPHQRTVAGFLQPGERREDGHAGAQQGVQLAREEQLLGGGDLALAPAGEQVDAGLRHGAGHDVQRRDAARQQLLGHGTGADGFELAADGGTGAAAGVAPLRHQACLLSVSPFSSFLWAAADSHAAGSRPGGRVTFICGPK